MVPKAVLFDLSEVLLVGLKGFDERLSSVIDAPREEISSALLGDHLTDFFLGKTSERKYFETVLE